MSSSSSEDDQDRLREAVDPNFDPRLRKNEELKHRKLSKRKISENEESFLASSPILSNYLNERLSEIIDRKIKEVDRSSCNDLASKASSVHIGGIKLFSSSAEISKLEDHVPITRKRSRIKEESSSDEDYSKYVEAAVSTDWVLEKKGVYGSASDHERT